ncbi:TMEM175 family protein [Lacticaseibacillus camelliae]|nr:TMEM175 family protein [Lacticaseibacillus camelliae]
MSKERLTTFIDAVLAIVMTILVLDLKLPEQ